MDAGSQVANGFVLFAVTDDPDRGFSAATTPSSGAWSDGTLFSFVDIGDDLGITVEDDDYPAGMLRTHFVSNDLLQGSGSPQSHLCNFTTGSDGELNLDLHVSYFDVATGQSVLMRAQANFLVSQRRASLDDIPSGLCGLPCQAFIAAMLATDPPAGDYPSADFNGDGDVDMLDFQIFSLAVGQSGGVEYVWNHENRLIEVVPLAPTTSSDKKVVFSYDAFGRRIRKQVFPWNDATSTWGSAESDTKFLYDGWRVIMEFDGLNSDAITRKHTWGLDLSGSMEGAGGIGGLLATEDTAGTATTTDDRTFIYFYDANGNVGQLIETTSGANYGAIAAHYEYSPYGERSNAPDAGEYNQPFRFSTKWFDDETGLGYWGYRHYDPTTGRWTSRDPIGERGGLNLYEYVRNNALSIIDVLGESPRSPMAGQHLPARVDSHPKKFKCSSKPYPGATVTVHYLFCPDGEKDINTVVNRVGKACDCAAKLACFFKNLDKIEPTPSECRSNGYLRDFCVAKGIIEGPPVSPLLPQLRQNLASTFGSITKRCTEGVTTECECSCGADVSAWVRPHVGWAVHLCPSWFENGAPWGTILHELSHFYGTIDDDAHGNILDIENNAHTLTSLATQLCDLADRYVEVD